ncbi:MAG: bifunctional phosphopantothenoylcysteine decarboxylase/phosphopantothenate--cysteine ligase CoaBC [Deltaproteobacteria bacterium]|nr:bifunctional phosphopantothenoylcysteine decarboxylase/phosphopantothenate--cysteine ligase CoaBC [Deltaproteobacteria bacterium]
MKSANEGPRVLLGVSGSIAAYKAVEIARLLGKRGASVRVAMTKPATEFVAPLTFEAVTGNGVLLDPFVSSDGRIEHVESAHEIDLLLIAPATANTIARLSHGLADDVLTATALSTRAPVALAPAMESGMWTHPATVSNVQRLSSFGYGFIGPATGDLASGRSGLGRMADPEVIVSEALALLGRGSPESGKLAGRSVLVTAGPTFEPIDPVRGLTNRSTGAMGIAIASAAHALGARVTLVLGPTHLGAPPGVTLVRVETADQMLAAAAAVFSDSDVLVATAAVSDFRPASMKSKKLKRSDDGARVLELVENPDVLRTLSSRKRKGQLIVGFAAETESVVENAQKKLVEKGCDLVVANLVDVDKGFGPGSTEVLLVGASSVERLGPADKSVIARELVSRIGALLE